MMTTVMNASSRTRTQTPVRAKTSTLTARTSPSIPAASEAYEPLLKSVLRHRLLYMIFPFSAAFSWGVAYSWNVWSQGGLSDLGIVTALINVVRPLTFVLALAAWGFGALPVVVLRKTYLIATPSPASSPSKTVQTALSKRSTFHALAIYLSSAILLTIVHIILVYTNEPSVRGDPRLTVFVKSRKHPYYLNGRFIFLLFSQMTCAIAFLLRNIMLDRFAVRWPTKLPPRSDDLLFTAIRIAFTTTLLSVLSIASYTMFFGLTRAVVLPTLFNVRPLRYLLKPVAAHFLRGSWTIYLLSLHSGLLMRSFVLGATTMATWEVAECLFDTYIAMPITITQFTADPTSTLISGLTSSSPYYQYFAYTELRQLASEDSPAASARRTALFADQKFNPSMWACLCRESLLLLGKDYQLFLRRGGPAPAPAAPAPAAPKKADPAPSTPLIRKPIFKPNSQSPVQSVIDSFGADGTITHAVSNAAEEGASHLPELFRSVAGVAPATVQEGTEVMVKEVEEVKGWLEGLSVAEVKKRVDECLDDVVRKYCPEVVVMAVDMGTDWWKRERVSKVVEGCLPHRELDVVVIEVLSHFTCASLNEDRYGVVQKDIPRILEALLSFLSATEDYHAELSALYTPPTQEEHLKMSAKELEERETMGYEVAKAGDVLCLVSDALKEGVARIVRTFGDKLMALRFPPRTARKLQGFVDYS